MLRYFAKDTHQEEYKVRAVLGECLKPKADQRNHSAFHRTAS